MREIKFRGKRLDNGKWVYGHYFETPLTAEVCEPSEIGLFFLSGERRCCISSQGTVFPINPSTVGQYWRTINDKHLFDGDIFRFKNGDGYIVRLVRYSEERAAFCIINPAHLKRDKWMGIEQIPEASWWRHVVNEIEIIGNIHDNPELLKPE